MLLYILFIIGFYLLAKGASVLVIGASAIAKRFQISDMVVGLTIVSFGTSLPELLINIFSSAEGRAALAIGNIFGSNVANLLLIIGVSALVRPLHLRRTTILTELPFSLIATLLVGFLANATLFDNTKELYISRGDGVILLFFFLMFMGYIYNIAKTSHETLPQEEKTAISPRKAIFYVLLGAAALFLGGKWVVEGAIEIARGLGLSESFIGLTILAIGTSLPELVTSATAAYRNNSEIAIGNVIGSNIFNLLWILGLSAIINPLPFDEISNLDIMMMIFSSTLLILVLPFGSKNKIGRASGILFLLLYSAYLVFLIRRG